MAKRTTPKKLKMQRLKALEVALKEDDLDAMSEIDMALGDAVAPQEWKEGFAALSEARAKFLASFYLQSEVNNGGFNQFLFNKGPEAVAPALAVLDERGPKKVADMLRQAVRALPGGRLPGSNEELSEVLAGQYAQKIDKAHDKLNDEYFEGDFDSPLIRARMELVRDHTEEFFGSHSGRSRTRRKSR
jgi:hypothetical protein